MKALTIWQPWASLIIAGAKPWEWRLWPPPRGVIGQRIVIHAGARPPMSTEIRDIGRLIRAGDSSLIADRAADCLAASSWLLRVGLGTAVVGEPITAPEWAERHLAPGSDFDRLNHHLFAWPLTDIRPFAAPVPMQGHQGLWNWPAEVAE